MTQSNQTQDDTETKQPNNAEFNSLFSKQLEIHHFASIAEIGQVNWDALMASDNPFCCYAYLHALEASGCVSERSGWQVFHLGIKQTESDTLIAVMPLYIKQHSWGEYVFDWAWAEAYERHEVEYYPKLVSSIPFTPATGPRLAISQALTEQQILMLRAKVAEHLQQLCSEHFSSWHQLFVPKTDIGSLQKGMFARLGTQFHWHNRGLDNADSIQKQSLSNSGESSLKANSLAYSDFSDFTQTMTSRKRKMINKERQKVVDAGIQFEFISGEQVTEQQWQTFYLCYQQTYLKRSGHQGYLNLAFFIELGKTMSKQIQLLVATDNTGNTVAMALYFTSATHLYGRYWGALVEVDGLHFEACYYQGIEYAIKNQLAVFEAGAQGEHKVARGFVPVATHSLHHVAHSGFANAIEDYCLQEAGHMKVYMAELAKQLPFKTN
ncbi:N-acetyltransferase [Shewanella sp. WXL01]|uniref:GNAT family N-acetyltransferase n=1 Tax=Shewanella sp. WXL01 TaxID=2709721 RepID=UPI001438588F|nr:GNAT family N-acetyltransferase [Shewanella sp. WXL01]NKF51629.1 N-acetyltransferase [Shewanella sp. WXL01]